MDQDELESTDDELAQEVAERVAVRRGLLEQAKRAAAERSRLVWGAAGAFVGRLLRALLVGPR